MSQLRVLVAGASIAGPSTAYWLARAGASVTVVERFPELRSGGQNVDIRTVGVTVMRKMAGMEPAVRAKIVPLEGLSFVRSDGRPYGVLRPTGDPDQQSVISEFEIFRGDLARILFDMTKDDENIKYVFGEQVAALRQSDESGGPVTVDFANGHPSAEYDLVVACDGATSRTRAIGMGGHVRDHVERVNTWAAYFSTTKDLMAGSKIGLAHSSAPGRFMSLGPDPLGVNRGCLLRIQPRDDRDATLLFREAAEKGDETLRRYVADEFRGSGWKTDEIVEEMLKSKDFYASEIVQVKPPQLFKGRFVMVGDAGYCPGPSGGGTSLALAGAYILAGEIAQHKGNLAAGLSGYEKTMRPLITDMQKIPPGGLSVMAPQTAWGLALRNNIFALVTRSGIMSVAQKVLASSFANAFASSEKYPLPDYNWGR